MGETGEAPPRFDAAALLRLRRLGGNALVRRMAGLFVSLGEERVAAARAGVEYGDLDTIERAAHSLKSSAGNVGAIELQRLAEAVERAAAEGRRSAAAAGVEEMEAAFAEARERIEEWTEGDGA
ncbi:MAG: Hpt domain-containing protein [Gemmatimonadetes bacterium]|nr:Hpt domain-containing protein [Gemmatimonadota bacterium]